ncbi:MAG: hypothetical protein PHQ23_16125, partial [Candidatus Wallbacteria bacterium]|nr:hypothetical protein [Candidatus Wallbacteria bacterium]
MDEKLRILEKMKNAKASDQQLITLLQTDRELPFDLVNNISAFIPKYDKFIEKLEKNHYDLAVVGTEKSGKSNFCNAIL